jgi:hypothetical protein
MQLGSLETGLDSYSGSILCCVLSLALKKTKENLSGNNEICIYIAKNQCKFQAAQAAWTI